MDVLSLIDGDTRGPIGPGIERFVTYWAARREPRERPPLYSSIKRYELAAQASSMVVFDAEENGEASGYRFRCREMGARHRDFAGQDITGKTLEDVFEYDDARFFSNIYWGVLTTGRPHYWRRPSPLEGREFELYERVIAPVTDPAHPLGTLVGLWQWTPLMGGYDEDAPPGRRGRRPAPLRSAAVAGPTARPTA